MAHQLRVLAAITVEFRKVVGVWLLVRKQQAETRQTAIDWIPAGADGAGTRPRHMNETDTGEIRRHLVDHPVRTRRTALLTFHPVSIDRGQT